MNRRSLIKFAASFPFILPMFSLRGQVASHSELVPVKDETTGLPLLKLPPKFSYRSFGWTGDPMSKGGLTPQRHDGMAVVPGKKPGEIVLLRNHEDGEGTAIATTDKLFYDHAVVPRLDRATLMKPSGGVTALTLHNGQLTESEGVLTGTMVNCAGGPTPWGTWLSCEEIVYRRSLEEYSNGVKPMDHGYVFETLPPHLGTSSHVPIKSMGLMRHEAVAVDPKTGYVYLTEDNSKYSGFYRFVPNDQSNTVGSLEKGGNLFMLKIGKLKPVNLTNARFGTELAVSWIPIAEPDADPDILSPTYEGGPSVQGNGMSGPYRQGLEQGGATFGRLEGCWHDKGIVYFVDTDGGPTENGSVWAYDPVNEKLSSCFTSKSERMADAIDNVTVNPVNGSIILCEDGGGIQSTSGQFIAGARLLLVGENNIARPVAENNINLSTPVSDRESIAVGDYRSSEWAGATFTPDGKTLYVNIQSPGVTFAIEGPWLG